MVVEKKNKETAEFILNNETPFFQIVDEPFKPLTKLESSILLQLIVGGLAGAILSILVAVLIFIISSALNTE